MNVNFGMSDLSRWSEFSGDRNPIHFDVRAASAIGFNEVVVHGMLAMLPLKAFPFTVEQHEECAVRWFAALRRPLPLSVSAKINIKEQDGQTRFSLVDGVNGQEPFIQGTFTRAPSLEEPLAGAPNAFTVEHDLVEDKLRSFKVHYPDVGKLWVFLDALAFFLYVSRKSQSIFAAEILEYLAERSDHDEARLTTSPLLVMHATHTVVIAPELLSLGLPERAPSVTYSAMGKDIVRNESSIYGVVEIVIFLNGLRSMAVDLGLIARL